MSRYDKFRRRIAPVAFLAALALIGRDMCMKQQRTHATIVLDLGEAAGSVRAIDAELTDAGDVMARFHRAALDRAPIGPCTFKVTLPDPDGELHLEIDLGATHKQVVRKIHAEEGATITVPLASDLR